MLGQPVCSVCHFLRKRNSKKLPVFKLSRVSAPDLGLKNRRDGYIRTSGVDNGVADAANETTQESVIAQTVGYL